MRIAIGIDTGGTYTDAVIYDFQNKVILATAKALTTKEELSVGILEALDALPPEYLQKAELISLSTTLATNACVEDKGGSAKLVFLGGDRGIIDAYGPEYGLPPAKDMLILDCYTTFSGQIERAVDWGAFAASIEGELGELDGIGVIELNGMKNSGIQERQAKRLIKEKLDTPVVCAHELFKELNCLQRGSSALLNARLIPVIREFLAAIKTAMQKRQIEANLVIVRSDGSLMSESSADTRPVETLLCGPAASVIGSIYLTGGTDTVVVDMGGTTTDIALVQDGSPVQAVNGVAIGNWRTFVNGFYVKTFGLGGDTAIHYSHNQLFLEKYRVVPLCVAAVKYPQIITNLNSLLVQSRRHTRYLHEHYILVKDISGSPRYSDDEKAFCAALESGPKIFREAAVGMPGRDVYNLDVSRLLSEGIVQVCGLTPTDIMHIKGDFNRFSVEASLLGAEFVAANLGLEIDELCDKVYDEIKRKLYLNIVMALLESQDSDFRDKGLTQETERFISKSYEMAKSGLTGQGGGAVSAAGGGGT
ncbi:MAG: hydantoinase/oxoprolinase family protein, partial [Coriobacteriia bacterium]|nr:hydantoinase/oxoprolinase family protein [Coriobacteriia bacterium]